MLDPAKAKAKAIEAAGLDDFGPDDFEEGLEVGLRAFAEVPLLPEARAQAEGKIVHDLTVRLKVEQYLKDHPEVLDERIDGPILITGLPRTGTTATVAMMALDARVRFLRMWEGLQPLPPPRLEDEPDDPRAVAYRARAAQSGTDQAMHLTDPDGPEEDLVLLSGYAMRSYHGAYPMPEWFNRWWIEQDFAPVYAMHEKILKILQSKRPPGLWLLKAPPHLFKLKAFVARYPTAKIVMTHRDPSKVIASDASLRYHLNQERCEGEGLDKTTYGPKLLAFWREGMERALADRAEIGEDRFLDVRNADVIARPLATFETLYEGLGMPMTNDLRAAIEAYLARNAQGAHGQHRYTAEEYGTSAEAIRQAFAFYCDRFGL